jgi:hypothetical protein
LGVIGQIHQLSDDELTAAIARGEAALPLLAGPAAHAFAELSLTALVFELYSRLELAGDHDGALDVLARFTDPDGASSPPSEPDAAGTRGPATVRGRERCKRTGSQQAGRTSSTRPAAGGAS